jgi:hypothetical protein
MRPLLSVLGLGPRFSRIEVNDDVVQVQFGWGFRADVPISSISNLRPEPGRVGGIGIHGWRGTWLVNGSALGLVGFDVEPAGSAHVLGAVVRLRHLRMSLEDPGGFLQRLLS